METKAGTVGSAFAAGGVAAVARLLAWGALSLVAAASPEAHMLTLLDAPTLAVYWLLSRAGLSPSVKNAFDPWFALCGVLTWFTLGIFTFGIYRLIRARKGRPTGLGLR